MITQCPKCHKTQEVPDVYRGREIKCLHCKEPFNAKDWVQPENALTQCQWCNKVLRTPKTNLGKVLTCTYCNCEFRAETYIPPPLFTPPKSLDEPSEPALCGILMFLAWLTAIVSVLTVIPSFGGSLVGIIPAIFLGWASQVLRHQAATDHYLRVLANRAAHDDLKNNP
jgi:hypothetical protein